jgi:DNA-binding transcriptional LysR family regulator
MLQSKARGVLRLNTSPGIPRGITSSITEYSNLYPEVTIHLTATSRMLDLVEEGFDPAVWYAAAPDPSVIIRQLVQYRMAACASPENFANTASLNIPPS